MTWWGDRQATIDYCKDNLPESVRNSEVIRKTFLSAAFPVVRLPAVISVWQMTKLPLLERNDRPRSFRRSEKWGYPQSDRASALERLAHLKGRSVLVCGNANDYLKKHPELGNFTFLPVPVTKIFDIPDGLVIHPHTDLWAHRESPTRQRARAWLNKHISTKK